MLWSYTTRHLEFVYSMANSQDIRSDLQLLYELSLAVGRSLDPSQVCSQFLRTLLRRKDFSYGAFWIDGSQMLEKTDDQHQLLYAMPRVRAVYTRLKSDHPSINLPSGVAFRHIADTDSAFRSIITERGVERGAYAIFRLTDFGVLKLYRDRGRIEEMELRQLRQVVDKLAIALKGAIAHSQAIETQKILVRETALLRGLIDSVPDLITFKNERSEFLGCNKAFAEYVNLQESELIGKTDLDLFSKEVAEFYQIKDKAMLDAGEARRNEEWIHYADGRRVLLDTLKTPFFSSEGEVLGLIGISRDITERKEAEARILNQQQFLETVIDAVADPVLVIDTDFQILISNKSARQIFKLEQSPAQVLEDLESCLEILLKNEVPCSEPQDSPVSQVLSFSQPIRQIRDLRTNSGVRSFELTANPYLGEKFRTGGIVLVARDITDKQRAEERIQFMAHHDALTGLPNRILLRDRFDQAVNAANREREKVALLFLDLDDFKSVNDSLGHQVGDHLLQAVVTRLQQRVREADTISRQGGDEFLIMLRELRDATHAEIICEDLLACFKESFNILDYRLHTSFSIGISIYPDDGSDFDSLLQKADTAMYSAKEAGRNTFRFFTDEMNQVAFERLQLQTRLRKAFEEGELSLAYQPQFDIASGRIVGVEALLRWITREFGTVPPDRFISIAEESGLIIQIGAWVLKEACRQAVFWQQKYNSEFTISVNLSALQLRRDGLQKTITEALEETGLSPDLLELELTESMLIKDTNNVMATVTELKQAGVKLAIDDFGTGYSSLSYLKKLKVDRLKIDRSFVRDILDDPEDEAIARAIVQMAHSLKLEVVAEGVEKQEQAQWLLEEGCELAQGNFFSRPVDAEEFGKVLKRASGDAKAVRYRRLNAVQSTD